MRFGILGNKDKENISEVLAELISFLQINEIDFCADHSLAEKLQSFSLGAQLLLECGRVIESSDIIISLGGDGTFLNTARLVGKREKPILGVNMGNLGFMAEIVPTEMKSFIQDIIKGDYRISERMIICANVPGEDFYGVNDIVIDRAKSIRMMEIEVYYNEEFVVKFIADGAIISTPTGSTGYSLSAGGPIITQGSEVFILTPICAHTLNVRPIIFPSDKEILIQVNKATDVRLTADGQVFKEFEAPLTLRVKKADYSAKIVKKVKSSYFETLNKKLLWGEDKRK